MSITSTGDRLEVIHDSAIDIRPQAAGVTATQPGESGAGVAEVQASTRPTFTITDAATACSVSRKTITRKLPELAVHGAAKDDDGVWRIPVEALLAVGLHPGRSLPGIAAGVPRPVAPAPTVIRPAEQETITIPRDRWDDVRIRLARAEAEASERGLALADARLALRALTAGPVTASRARAEMNVPDHAAWVASDGASTSMAQSAGSAAPADAAPPTDAVAAASSVPGIPLGPAVSSDATSPGATSPGTGSPASMEGADSVPADVVAARNLAARTGGYVPAGATRAKKRRWWQSR